MRPKVLISQKILDEVVTLAEKHFEVDYHSSEFPLPSDVLIQRLKDKMGAITLLTDRIDDDVFFQCLGLKIVSNTAMMAAENLVEGLLGRRPPNLVNKEVLS
jgi:lactate dehydrogenase-like 2-hydroxyacid dehydrogenase